MNGAEADTTGIGQGPYFALMFSVQRDKVPTPDITVVAIDSSKTIIGIGMTDGNGDITFFVPPNEPLEWRVLATGKELKTGTIPNGLAAPMQIIIDLSKPEPKNLGMVVWVIGIILFLGLAWYLMRKDK